MAYRLSVLSFAADGFAGLKWDAVEAKLKWRGVGDYFSWKRLISAVLVMEVETRQKASDFVGMQAQSTGLGFVARDRAAREQQQSNQITFCVIRNDEDPHNLRQLLDLKNIFARQLPKMPREYIVKLVFDRSHESMVILRHSKVVGGICFREFKQERFAEIAFLAITSTEQIKGFGTRLMNKLKEEMQHRRVEFLMTYADNLALGYFRKQGFSRDARMPQERWKGYIKDYEGGTMMECAVHPTIDYARISDIIRAQKEFIVQKIKELSINHRSHEGGALRLGEPFTRRNGLGEEETFQVNPLEIPGVRESGWGWKDHEELIRTKEVSFLLECQNVLELMKKHQSSWPFREPILPEDVPDYFTVIREPIDLKTIEKRLSSNEYQDRSQFAEDISRIFKNCRAYNQPETVYFKCASELEEYIKSHLDALEQGRSDTLFTEKRLQAKLKKKPIEKKTKKREI